LAPVFVRPAETARNRAVYGYQTV